VTVAAERTALNGICPYFTMFPLEFPLRVLQRAGSDDCVLDPFSGRGTTNYASRLLGLPSVGIDSSPVAVALTQAKLANVRPEQVERCARRILETQPDEPVPAGKFWELAYDRDVLRSLVRLRAALNADSRSAARKALRALLLGALHGPVRVGQKTYLSNQCPRTYAPKPGYAVRFWTERQLSPPPVDVGELISLRAQRYFRHQRLATGFAFAGDSRQLDTFTPVRPLRPRWIITSPPYYGMRTYIPDQWLRNWFLGGPAEVDYSTSAQLGHQSPETFAAELRQVWRNIAAVAAADARMVIRFGGIADRQADPLEIIKASLSNSAWKIRTVVPAQSAEAGKRQALTFIRPPSRARSEYDIWAQLS
jgi:hypothetical protein